MSGTWRLRVERGPNAGQSFTIDGAQATIGRQEHNTVVLDDARLSRQHARIERGPAGFTVTDLNSANGTLVNGRTVAGTVPLGPGDRVQLGDTVIVVEDAAPASSGVPAASSVGGGTPPRLIVQDSGKVYRLDRPALIMGRQPDVDLPLEDTQASRQHARFETEAGRVTVIDLGSANGTRVNGAKIAAPTILNDGDVVQIGTSFLRVEGAAFVDGGTAIALGFYPPPPSGAALDAPAPSSVPALPEDHGTAAALGFFPPPVSAPALDTAPMPAGSPPPAPPPPPAGGPIEGATVFGEPPAGALAPPPPARGFPAASGSPDPPPGQPWNAPPGPQLGGTAPPIPGPFAVPPPPPTTPAARKRSPLPLILAAVGVLVLLCVAAGAGAVALARRGGDPTATPVSASASSTPGASAVASASSSAVAPPLGSSGGNAAPPPPGAAPAPSSAPVAPTAGAAPSAAPTTPPAAGRTPTARASAPATTAGRQTITIEEVGLQFTLPADWRQARAETGQRWYVSGDGRAQLVLRYSTQVASGLTARRVIENELLATENEDPDFDSSAVRTAAVTVGGQAGHGTDPYRFTAQSGTRYAEQDRAVVISGRAQYFFGFVAQESAFNSYAAIFDEIIATIRITGP